MVMASHSSSDAVQALGALIQAYASILTIFAAFYILQIDKMADVKTKFQNKKNKLLEHSRSLKNDYNALDTTQIFEISLNSFKRHVAQNYACEAKESIEKHPDYRAIEDEYQEYEDLKKKASKFDFSWFWKSVVFSVITLISQIVVMYSYTLESSRINMDGFYFLVVIASILGIGYLFKEMIMFAKTSLEDIQTNEEN